MGAKDEEPNRTGFAHFFEHLLFKNQNIERGKWLVSSLPMGKNNAYTNDDFTYYYEVFPSNNPELGLWLESERMPHPVINQIGVDTQNEAVKEENVCRDNLREVFENVKKNQLNTPTNILSLEKWNTQMLHH